MDFRKIGPNEASDALRWHRNWEYGDRRVIVWHDRPRPLWSKGEGWDGFDWTGAWLKNSAFTECTFHDTILAEVDFRGARFTDCTFHGADLRRAELYDATFNRCDFGMADLTDVKVDRGTKFKGCTGLPDALLRNT